MEDMVAAAEVTVAAAEVTAEEEEVTAAAMVAAPADSAVPAPECEARPQECRERGGIFRRALRVDRTSWAEISAAPETSALAPGTSTTISATTDTAGTAVMATDIVATDSGTAAGADTASVSIPVSDSAWA